MPKIVRTPQIQTRLSKDDNARLDRICVAEKKTKTEITREAIRWYLHEYDRLKNEEKESQYAREIKGMTNRICAMLSGIRVEVGTLYEIAHDTMQDKSRFEAALNCTRKRIAKKLTEQEQQIVQSYKKVINP